MNNTQKLEILLTKLEKISSQKVYFVSGVLDELRDHVNLFAGNGSFEERYSNFKKWVDDENFEAWSDFVNEHECKKEAILSNGIRSLRQLIAIDEAMQVI